ncbi:hypothetical protein OPV22_025640 [Ensete ventricosum]|uniref:Protein TIFY n=1 Tax=Ensete ventricosum TaxID=4639 RepID=A0AAV8QG24_ENSVE|nr:hypothetical protein OPV22_025640 [Ensete ventricosum]
MSGGKEDTKGSRHDAGSAVRWPFINKASAMQQFMLHKAAQAERANKYRFDRLSSPTFHPVSIVDAFEADRSDFPPALAQQRSFSLHDYQPQPTTAFSSSTRQLSEAGTFPVVSHHSPPITTNSPFFKFHGTQGAPHIMITNLNQQPLAGVALNTPVVNTSVGALPSWNMPKPTRTSAQLTIFYAGTVNVYDDVSVDKAQAIMMLASKGSNGAASRSEAPLSVPPPVPPKISGSDGLNGKQILNPTPIRVASPSSVFSNPMPVTLHTVANSSSICNTKNDSSAGAKVAGTLAPSTQQGPPRTSSPAVGSVTSAAIVPRAVPQARKASLARFLEKRKERVNDAMPYSCIKKTPEIGSGPESASASSISSSADVNVSSNREHSLDLRNQKSGISCGDSLSTKLRI